MSDLSLTYLGYVEVQWALTGLWEGILRGQEPAAFSDQPRYEVAYDAPALPGTATRTAARAAEAVKRHRTLREWVTREIRRVVVHAARGPDAIVISDDSIHFFEAKESADAWATAERLFDHLTSRQRASYTELTPPTVPAREDFVSVFAWIAASADRERLVREKVGHICQDLMRSGKIQSQGLLELLKELPSLQEDWSEEKNSRRRELIDKQIQGTLSGEELLELNDLQRQAVAYRDRVAPLPLEGARRLHSELLEKKRRSEAKE